jgi:hypothetical protein
VGVSLIFLGVVLSLQEDTYPARELARRDDFRVRALTPLTGSIS